MLHILKRKFSSSGSESIYKSLLYNNVKNIFMYKGYDTSFTNINSIVSNDEQNCGYSAIGYAKSSNKTGVIVSHKTGLTNMITPILHSTNESTPLVLLSNMNTLETRKSTEITKPYTKWSYCAKSGDNLYELINKAFTVANEGKKGSVHIDLPKCILNDINGENINFDKDNEKEKETDTDTDFIFLHEMIVNSKKPILYIGKGCNNDSKDLYKFAIKYNIYVTTTIHAMGVFNENHLLSLGMYELHVANHAIQNTDLIIALGTTLGTTIGTTIGTISNISKYAPMCKNIIHVNIEESELAIDKVIDKCENTKVYKLHMECSTFLNKINNVYTEHNNVKRSVFCNKKVSYPAPNRFEWDKQIDEWKKVKIKIINDTINDTNKLNTQMFIEQINKSINNKNTIITSGVGNHQILCAEFITWTQPNQFITSLGLSYSIGVQIANPDKIVINIDEDRYFNNTLVDLQTISRYQLPIKIFIINNSKISIGTEYFFKPNYNLLALSYGIHTITIENKTELQRMIEYVLNYKDPIICNVKVQF